MCKPLADFGRLLRLVFENVCQFFFSILYNCRKKAVPDLPRESAFLAESAVALANKIKSRELKSEDLVRAVIERIKQVNPIVNAVVDDRYEAALDEARKIDQEIEMCQQDLHLKPFLGVPFTTKETQAVKGMSFTWGLWCRRGKRAEEDCAAVTRLRAAGAIPVAATNLPELLIWSECRNPVYGTTNNPHHTGRTSGGSSGGDAALTASYATVISLTSDIGGSSRIPSFYCGMFGYHPTADVVNLKGLFQRNGTESSSMLSFGFISKHVEDMAPLMKVIACDKADQLGLDRVLDVKNIKIYYNEEFRDIWISPIRSELKDAMRKVIIKFGEVQPTGNKPRFYGHKFFNNITNLWRYWMTMEPDDHFAMYNDGRGKPNMFVEILKKLIGLNKHTLYLIMRLAGARFYPAVNSEWATQLTQDCKDDLFSKLGDNGVLLLPSGPIPSPFHYFTYLAPYNHGYFAVANVLKCPAVQVPVGVNNKKIPIGIQVLAAPHQDALCLAVAKYLEKEFGGAIMACNIESTSI